MSGIGPELLARLLDQRGPALELYARQWCDSPADVVQEALVQLSRQPAEPANLLAWLYRAVRNGAISARRAADRRRRHERAAAVAGECWFTADPGAGLDPQTAGEALADLPLDEREVIVAHLWGGLTFAEIADITGTSASTAHRRYRVGLEALRQKLGVTCSQNDRHPRRSRSRLDRAGRGAGELGAAAHGQSRSVDVLGRTGVRDTVPSWGAVGSW